MTAFIFAIATLLIKNLHRTSYLKPKSYSTAKYSAVTLGFHSYANKNNHT